VSSCSTDRCPRRLSASSRTQVISILCRLLVDRTIVHNSHAVVAIEEALDSIVDAIAEDCLDNDVSGRAESFLVAFL